MTGWSFILEVMSALIAIAGILAAIRFIVLGLKDKDDELYALNYLVAMVTVPPAFLLGYWASGPAWVFAVTVTCVGLVGFKVYRTLLKE